MQTTGQAKIEFMLLLEYNLDIGTTGISAKSKYCWYGLLEKGTKSVWHRTMVIRIPQVARSTVQYSTLPLSLGLMKFELRFTVHFPQHLNLDVRFAKDVSDRAQIPCNIMSLGFCAEIKEHKPDLKTREALYYWPKQRCNVVPHSQFMY